MMRTPLYKMVFLLTMGAVLTAVAFAQTTNAASGSDWRPGNIISDQLFFNGNAMSLEEIQAFLNSQVPVCDTWGTKAFNSSQTRAQYGASVGAPPPFVCVRDYYENPTTHETNFNPTASIPAGAKSAAQIILDAARTYNISPRVLLVTLKKEAAVNLIGDDWPMLWQYRSAMGYGCPDTAPCDAQYYGFYNQMMNSARQFRSYASYPNSYRYKAYQNNFVQYNPNAACSGTYVLVENQATAGLYNYTPYQPNQAALANMYGSGDNCSAYGNRNFWRIWSDWFGSTSGPAAFTVPGSNQIYIPVQQYKLRIPYAAAMQDYGISWEAVKNVPQEYVDSIPTPPGASGISSSISHVVKTLSDSDADGGSIYLISLGKRYQFQSMDQFLAFGFQESDLSYLPIEYVLGKQNGGALSNYITSPHGSVFEVNTQSKTKRIIFEYSTYIGRNPSDTVASLSYYLADKITSGGPIVDRPVLIKYSSGEALLLYNKDGSYNSIPTYDEYSCWGFETSLKTPVYRIPQNTYIAPVTSSPTLSCMNTVSGTSSLLANGKRITIPQPIGYIPQQLPANLEELYSKIPSRNTPLSQYVKVNGSAGVWYINNLMRRVIPTYDTYMLLGLNTQNVDTIPGSMLAGFSYDGILLARGQIIKDTASAAVYVTDGQKRYGFATSDIFLSYRNPWADINTISVNDANKNYPIDQNISPILVDKVKDKVYAIALNGCYIISNPVELLGKSIDQLSASQPYDSDIFRNINLASCKTATSFMRAPDQSLVYWINNGQKTPLTTFASLLQKNNGTEPSVLVIDPLYLRSIPTVY